MDAWLLWLHMTLMASIRLTLGLVMTPLFSAFGVPALARIILVLAFASFAASLTLDGGAATAALPTDMAALARSAGGEVAVGLLMAVGVHTAFAAFAIAGRLMDIQMGFSLGAALDPVSKGHSAVMTSSLNLLAVLLFFVSEAHQLLLAAFFKTFELMPVGQALGIEGWLPVAQGAGVMFSLGFAVAAPVVVALLLADVVVAVVSRNLPQMNVMFLSIPIKVLLGLAVAVVSVRLLGPVTQKVLMVPIDLLDKVQ
ncbi:MAG: flagellar biosynthetic protein FliR [Aquabacterium sp.]|uniref:flagellar biosynthetic protein FliR n=1 Tax=Aquabacterium sp. TaxID=1872578 RepID=UPI0027196237|nr:flagellar biosynthetic protein FliR [Aquabacterium sp.]MDO9005750.1 flagellar biosynthetic protein FliR [Aquabacterium sp.]